MKRFSIIFASFFIFLCLTAPVFAQSVQGMNPDVMRSYQDFAPVGTGMDMGGFSFGAAEEATKNAPALAVTAVYTLPTETQPGYLYVTAEIPESWMIYSVTQKPGGPQRTKIQLPKEMAAAGAPVAFPDGPRVKYEPEAWGPNLPVEYHTEKVQWRVPFRWAEQGVAGESAAFSGSVYAQMCQDEACLEPQDYDFTASLIPTETAPAVNVPVVENVTQAEMDQQGMGQNLTVAEPVSIPPAGKRPLTLVMAVIFAFLGGLILNLMPCVLPVIGPKLFSFAKQAHESHWRVFQLNAMYSLGLLSVFWVLATLSKLRDIFILITGRAAESGAMPENLAWGEQFTIPAFVIGMIALVFVMGLSFLGVWEIPIPGFVTGGKAGQVQKKEGLLGAFLMGILTTILATPCVGPFLGPVFGWALAQPIWIVYLVFTCIGLGLASPYLTVGIFPAAVKWLPKPGEWMETLKEFMGFFFMGTVVYLFYILNPVYFVPTLGFLMGLWLACWIIGKVTYSGAGPESVRAAWCGGIMLAAGIGYLMFTFLCAPKQIDWQEFSVDRVAAARDSGQVVFVDFTANWCLTCKTNSVAVIEKPEVAKFVSDHRIVPVLADWTERSPEIKAYLNSLNRNAIPLIVIWVPGEDTPILLDGLITKKQLFDALEEAVAKKEKNKK